MFNSIRGNPLEVLVNSVQKGIHYIGGLVNPDAIHCPVICL